MRSKKLIAWLNCFYTEMADTLTDYTNRFQAMTTQMQGLHKATLSTKTSFTDLVKAIVVGEHGFKAWEAVVRRSSIASGIEAIRKTFTKTTAELIDQQRSLRSE